MARPSRFPAQGLVIDLASLKARPARDHRIEPCALHLSTDLLEACLDPAYTLNRLHRIPPGEGLSLGVDIGDRSSWAILSFATSGRRVVAGVYEISDDMLQGTPYAVHAEQVMNLAFEIKPDIIVVDSNGCGADAFKLMRRAFPDHAWGLTHDPAETNRGRPVLHAIPDMAIHKLTFCKRVEMQRIFAETWTRQYSIASPDAQSRPIFDKFCEHHVSNRIAIKDGKPILKKGRNGDHLLDAHIYSLLGLGLLGKRPPQTRRAIGLKQQGIGG